MLSVNQAADNRFELLLIKPTVAQPLIAAAIPVALGNGPGWYKQAVSPDGQYVAHNPDGIPILTLTDVSVRIPRAMHVVGSDDGYGQILWLSFRPDGQYLACASNDGVRILKVPSLEKVWQWKSPGSVTWVQWAADNRHLVTHNGNKTMYVLRLDELGDETH